MRCTSRPAAVASRSRRTSETGHWWRAWPTTAPVCRSTCAHGFSTLFFRGVLVASVSASPSCSRSCRRILCVFWWVCVCGVVFVLFLFLFFLFGWLLFLVVFWFLVVVVVVLLC